MIENDKIIKSVDATMSMDSIILGKEDKEQIVKCLEDEVSYEEEIERLIKKYSY